MEQVGQIVISKSGRDKGRYFVVVGTEGEFVFYVDGELRKLARPKKKKLRHVKFIGLELDTAGKTDGEIKRLLKETVKEDVS